MGIEWHNELQMVTECHKNCHRGWNSKAGFMGDESDRLQTALVGLRPKWRSGPEFFGLRLYSEKQIPEVLNGRKRIKM